MAKKKSLIEKVEQDNLSQKSPFNKEGINSFLKDAITSQGKEYSEEAGQKILDKYSYDYDKLVDDIGRANNVPEDKLEKHRESVYGKYGFSRPSDTDIAEMEFVKAPIVTDPEAGYQRYKELQDELTLTDAFIQNIEGKRPVEEAQVDESGMPLETIQSDVTKVSLPPEQLRPTDPRVLELRKKESAIQEALKEQYGYNLEKLGFGSEEHEALSKEKEAVQSLIKETRKELEERATPLAYSLFESADITTEDKFRLAALKDIETMYDDIDKLLGAHQTDDKKAKALLYGFSENFFTKDFATLGLSEMSRLMNVKDAFDTRQKLIDEGKTDEEIQQIMPSHELALIDTYQTLLEIQAGADPNNLYYWGEGLKEMIPFIAQFAATQGAGAGAKEIVKNYVTSKTKSAVAGKIAGAIAKPLTQASLMVPANLQGYAERVAPTLDEEGNLIEGMNPLKAAVITYANTVAEVVGEDVGTYVNKAANKAARASYRRMIGSNPNAAQKFLGKMALTLTRDTNIPSIQGVAFEGLGEEVTGILQAVINQDDSFFTSEAQKQIWGMSLIASGSFMSASAPQRLRARSNYNNSKQLLDDIPNGEYASAVEQLSESYDNIEDLMDALGQINEQFGESVTNEDKLKARNFVSNTIVYNQMNTARALRIEEQIAQSIGDDGNVTLAQYEGQPYSVRNPQDLGKDGTVIFLKDKEGNVKPVISSKITDWDSKSSQEIVDETLAAQDEHDVATEEILQQQEQTMANAAEKGLEVGKTVETPQGKKTLVSINPDGTSTVVNDKGEETIVNTDEIEAYKTQEQKEAEKAEQAAAEEIISEEPLFEGSDIIVIDYANGTSVIRTPEGDQAFETQEERDAAIQALAESELEAAEQVEDVSPEQVFAETYESDPEIATEALTMEIEGIRAQSNDLRKQAKEAQSAKERVDLLKQAKELEVEAQRLEGIIADPTQLQAPVEEEVVEEPVQIERTPDVIYSEFQQEKENAPYNQLLPWQQDLLTRKINPESFNKFGDRNVVTPAMSRAWFESKDNLTTANNIDAIAEELSEQGLEVTTDDIVNFIVDNPSASVRNTTDRMTDLQREYKELTGQPISKHAEPLVVTQEEAGTPFRAAPDDYVVLSDQAQKDLVNKTRVEPTLNELQSKFGIPIQVINSSEMPEHVKRAAEGKDITAAGFYDPQTKTAYFISDNIKRIVDVKKTYLHEAVLHKGLDAVFDAGPVTLLGKTYETKADFLDDAFSRMDDATIADRMKDYAKGLTVEQLTDNQKREIAEEALATLSETESPRLQVMFDKLVHFIRKLFGFTSKQLSNADLRVMLNEHQNLLKQQRDAETVRSDERQVPGTGIVEESSYEESSQDIQQQEAERVETGEPEGVKFRDTMQENDLVVLHNLSGDNILHSDRLGGIPVPSLAVTRKHIPFTGFGDITMVGDVSMVDPNIYANKTFAADAYSPRTPKKLYDVGRSGYDKLHKELVGDTYDRYGRDIWNEVSNAVQGSNLEREIQEYSPEELVNNYKDRLGLKIGFLAKKEMPLRMPTKPYKLRWNGNNGIFETLTADDKKWINDNKDLLGDYFGSEDLGSNKHKSLTEFFEKKAVDEVKEKYDDNPTAEDFALSRIFIDPNIGDDGLLMFSPAHNFYDSIKKVESGKSKPDPQKLRDRVNSKFTKKLNEEYEQWLYDSFNEVQGAEYFEAGRKKMPYNLDNLVDAMSGKIRGQEGTVFKSLAGARAKNVKQFKSVAQMQKEKENIIRGDEVDKIKEELNNKLFSISNSLESYYEYSNRFGQLDDMTEVIADYIKNGKH